METDGRRARLSSRIQDVGRSILDDDPPTGGMLDQSTGFGIVGGMITPEEWAERYRQCWETADADAVRELFTPDATYRSDIFAEPHRGRDGIAAYWRSVTEPQSDVSVRMGRPIVGDERVAVEWWTEMDVDGEPTTIPGCLLLRFDADGLCTELEEYFRYAPGRQEPPANWGL